MVYLYNCSACRCCCKSKYDYYRHCETRKHKLQGGAEDLLPEITYQEDIFYSCVCGKNYKQRSSLSKHRKKCNHPISGETSDQIGENIISRVEEDEYSEADIDEEDASFSGERREGGDVGEDSSGNMVLFDPRQLITPEFIMNLIRQNQDLKNLLLEQQEQMSVIITSNEKNREEIKNILEEISEITKTTIVNTTTHNTQFNLNIFLNEKCKDAISLTDFVNSLDVGPHNVEYTGVHGYVAGITKIFMDGLRQLEMNERPIHCTDLKREILYIKEKDTWEKDSPEKTKFKKALGIVVRKNMQQLRTWMSQNPRCEILDTNEYHLHLKIMQQCIGGDISQEDSNNRKIIRNIAKEVMIDRSCM